MMPMTKNQEPIIKIQEICKHFPGVQALDRVSVDIYPGEVHAIIGENGAGKSTLMNILAGEVLPDSGKIIYMGEERQIANPFVSQQMGISVVYQEIALCPNLNAVENINLNLVSAQSSFSFVKRHQLRKSAQEVMSRLGMHNISYTTPVGKFTIAQQQLVEIAKALSIDAKVLILDEPNSALTHEETDHLFKVLRQLIEAGVAIIYISHRLEEVLTISDKITILRDGCLVDTIDTDEASIDGLISLMVGREVHSLFERVEGSAAQKEVVFELDHLDSGSIISNLKFSVHAGEIVGVAGLPDSGKDELIECLYGLQDYSGSLMVNGEKVKITSPTAAIQCGLSFIPADRRGSGSILVLNVQDNIIASSLKDVNRFGVIQPKSSQKLAQDYVAKLDIRLSNLKQKMGTLSGGNQQKAILARGLATRPAILLLHEPTRGIDVGAKADIYAILHNLAREGVGILIVSSELPELIGQCDRILVMHQGRLTGEFTSEQANEPAILACAMGQAEHFVVQPQG
jgi:ABC-type sugar transport system ATPase subunit